jgi:antitoxin component of MazEF toxin-antitoxin module
VYEGNKGGPRMLAQKLRQVGNSYVVTIPKEEVERLGLQVDDLVGIEVHKLRVVPELAPDVAAAFQWSIEYYAADYEYLKDH